VTSPKVIDVLAARLAARGVKRFFGVPGGDCSLDLIAACGRVGIEFVLTRTESAAAIMASVTAELTGAPGVLMATRGPGLANAVNGIAYAALDRAPLLVLADGYDPQLDRVSHQRYDQHALMRPLVKGSVGLGDADPAARIDGLLDLAAAPPAGPEYIQMRGIVIRAHATSPGTAPPPTSTQAALVELPAGLDRLLASARRPLVIAGMQASQASASRALRKLVARWNCPVLQTYKSFGTVSSDDPHAIGFYVGGMAEESALKQADLIVLYGFDAIEFPPHRWRAEAPVVELSTHAFERNIVQPAFTLVGALDALAEALQPLVASTAWPEGFADETRAQQRHLADAGSGEGPITPQRLVDALLAAAPEARRTRLALDAGAHMLPVLHTWHATEPQQSLISRGLATMAFALPAAIASSLAEPERPVVACTGDGGLMMCMGELGTAVQYGCRLVVVVFNDASLTLIGAKQRRRELANAGVDFSAANFADAARGFGALGLRVEQPEDLAPALTRAFAHPGVSLVDVAVNPDAYHAMLVSLRG
jgi:acetolactate synthase-1/2/3 large subunit